MAQLRLPETGSLYLDACVFIYSVEKLEPFHTLLEPIWHQAGTGSLSLVTSELTIAEVLAKPIRDNDQVLVDIYRELFASSEILLIPTTRLIWEETARLRALTNLRTPDAVHAATALQEGCAAFVTNDRAFRRIEPLSVIVPQEALPGQ